MEKSFIRETHSQITKSPQNNISYSFDVSLIHLLTLFVNPLFIQFLHLWWYLQLKALRRFFHQPHSIFYECIFYYQLFLLPVILINIKIKICLISDKTFFIDFLWANTLNSCHTQRDQLSSAEVNKKRKTNQQLTKHKMHFTTDVNSYSLMCTEFSMWFHSSSLSLT